MEFIPAIDLIEGVCVRLVQGDFNRQISYGDPVEAAEEIESKGASWLHVVDLDAARSQEGPNRKVIKDICAKSAINIEVGGGIRSLRDAQELLSVGVSRVIVGTMAIEDPSLIERISELSPGAAMVGLDYRKVGERREIAIRGWTQGANQDLFDVLPSLLDRGATGVVATDIARDGTFTGPDVETLERLLSLDVLTDFDVIASGGVSSLDDLERLKLLETDGRRIFGAISGRAVHDGRIDIGEAIKLCRT